MECNSRRIRNYRPLWSEPAETSANIKKKCQFISSKSAGPLKFPSKNKSLIMEILYRFACDTAQKLISTDAELAEKNVHFTKTCERDHYRACATPDGGYLAQKVKEISHNWTWTMMLTSMDISVPCEGRGLCSKRFLIRNEILMALRRKRQLRLTIALLFVVTSHCV